MQFVYWRSKRTRYCEGNLGNRNEQKVDVAFIKAHPAHGEVIEALIEAKYLQNRSRLSPSDHKYDEIRSTLKDLARQLHLSPSDKHAGYHVALRARTVRVYGLVFASYVCRADEPNRKDLKKKFFRRVIEVAKDEGLQYHDLPKPYLLPGYEDHPITLFGGRWLVSLRAALWRLRRRQGPFE